MAITQTPNKEIEKVITEIETDTIREPLLEWDLVLSRAGKQLKLSINKENKTLLSGVFHEVSDKKTVNFVIGFLQSHSDLKLKPRKQAAIECLAKLNGRLAELPLETIKPSTNTKGEDQTQKYTEAELATVLKKFKDPKLMYFIFQELSKRHIGDDKEKMLLFFTSVLTMLPPKERFGVRVCGDSSGGKDNMIESVLNHMPDGCFETYTGASDKYLLYCVDGSPGLYVGELNLQKINGNNKNQLEIIKAAMEGGTSYGYLEKDGDVFVPRKKVIERKVVFYSTTEISQDDELATRCLTIPVSATQEQTKAVLDKLIEIDYVESKINWVKIGLSHLKNQKMVIVIPIEIKKVLIESMDSQDIRARRDSKRLLSLIKSSAFIHQLQRPIDENIVYATAADVYNVLSVLGDCLNRSYSGLEKRLERVLSIIKQLSIDQKKVDEYNDQESWVSKAKVVKAAKIKGKNRQADVFKTLQGLLLIESQPSESDRRYWEVRPTNSAAVSFIQKNVLDLIASIPPTAKCIPITQNQHTELIKIGLESVELSLDKYPAVNFLTGEIQHIEPLKTDSEKNYLNLSKPIIKPIIQHTEGLNDDKYISVGGMAEGEKKDNKIDPIVKKKILAKIEDFGNKEIPLTDLYVLCEDLFFGKEIVNFVIADLLSENKSWYESRPGVLKKV